MKSRAEQGKRRSESAESAVQKIGKGKMHEAEDSSVRPRQRKGSNQAE